jgi:hypothetical protein
MSKALSVCMPEAELRGAYFEDALLQGCLLP